MQKQEKIVKMFDDIAPSYDKANRAISFGVDSSWRNNAANIVLDKFLNEKINIVDVACGTGDMLGTWMKNAEKKKIEIQEIIGVDPSQGMLEVAKEKFPNSKFIQAYADKMDIPDNFADILSISYGIRNVVERQKALREFNRIIKKNGYLVVLEFTKMENKGFIAKSRNFYINKILPKIGAYISKNKEAYEYLPSSIENFLDSASFKNELFEAGFELSMQKGYSFDVSTLFLAKKIEDLKQNS